MNPKAIYFMLISAAAFALVNFFVKYLEDYSSFQLVFFRSFAASLLCFAYLKKAGIPILGNRRKLLALRGIVGTTSICLFYVSIKLIPLSSAVSLRYLSPLFGIALAIPFLKERVRPIQWLFFLMALGGAVLLKGFDPEINLEGFTMVMLSAFTSGIVYVIIRKLGKSEHPVVIVNYLMVCGIIVGLAFSLSDWQQPTTLDWLILLSLGLLGFIGQLFMTKAMQIEETNKVAPLKYAEVLFVLILGMIWLEEKHHIMAFVGMILIVAGISLNSILKKNKAPSSQEE